MAVSYRNTNPTLANLGDVERFNPNTTPSGYVVTWNATSKTFQLTEASTGSGAIYATTADRLAAVGTVPPGTLATCLEEEGQVWVMNSAGDAWVLTNQGGASAYTEDFLIADWTLSGSNYLYSVTAAVHDMGTKPSLDLFETLAGPAYTLVGAEWSMNSDGNITITVPSSPDCRFNGRVIIHR